MTRMKIGAVLLAASVAATVAMRSEAQSGRTLEELKAEAQARADRNAYPLIGLKPDEVREALARLTSLDRDEWAASWSQIGDRYMAKKDFHQAWLYYSFARWPVPNSPGKQRAYDKALQAYLEYAKKYDPPLEVLRVPYEGNEVVGYVRMPKNAAACSTWCSRARRLMRNAWRFTAAALAVIGRRSSRSPRRRDCARWWRSRRRSTRRSRASAPRCW